MRQFFLITLLVLTINVVAGWLGLQLAIPPGYATAIWPPSGVALASALIWRHSGLLGVGLASFVVNMLSHDHLLSPSLEGVLTSAWIATAATIQAGVAAYLVRRYVGYPTRLNRVSDILRFFALAGPLACLISATLSVGYLVSSGVLDQDSADINWLTWWVGDTIGVIVFAPLMFLVFALPRGYWRRQSLSIGVPLILVILFTGLMYRQGLYKELENQEALFQGQAQSLRLATQSALDEYTNLLYGLREVFYANHEVSPEDFQRYALETLQRNSSLQGLSWHRHLRHYERLEFEARMQEVYRGIPFTITERHPEYGFVPAEQRSNYVVVTVIAPFAVNQAALGFDVLSDPVRRQAMETAVKTGKASATAPVRLVQETEAQWGTQIFLPAFHSRSTPGSEGERFDALSGYGAATVRVGDLIKSVLSRHGLNKSLIRLYPQSQPEQVYYQSEAFSTDRERMLFHRSNIQVGADLWVLEQAQPRYPISYSWGFYFILAGGFMMTALLGCFLLILAGRASEITSQVRMRTKELQKSHELLAESQRIAQMGSWEWAHNGQEHSWSDQFYRLLGLKPGSQPASEALFLQQVAPDQAQSVERALDAALRGQRLDVECTLRVTGAAGERERHLSLKGERVLTGGRGKRHHYLSIVARDITDQRHAEQELELAAITFETHEAIVITDADTVIQRVNSAFCQITGYSSAEVIGRKISLLRSGRHGDNFYRELWQSLILQGHWHGEIWNRRKDGSVFPELATITAVDAVGQGQTSHYVAAFLDITDKKASEERIRYLAYYDSITGLPNRDLFLESLRQQLAHCERHQDYSTLMFMDLDNFKMLNDSLGHDMGDQLLKSVAERLTDTLRAEDIVSRFGGDEFLFLLPAGLKTPELALDQAAHVAERILQTLDLPFDLKGHSHKVSASMGITYLPQPKVEAEGYIQQADTAMYRAKNAGKAAFAFYEPDMQAEVLRRLELEKAIRTALEQDQFLLFYQPQHDNSGAMVGCEALIRWQHPEQGIVAPGAFIGVAEESTLIIDLGLQVLEKACHQIQQWSDTAMAGCEVSVNISSRHFAHPSFIRHIESVLERHPCAKGLLWLEITEGVFLKSGANLNETFIRLKQMQVRCSIDDFGTGYSSLGYLKNLDIDQIKIAQEFVRDLVEDEKDAQLVKAIMQMGLSLGIDLVAEGVETEAQYQYLCQLGCPCYQGYWFAKPMPAKALLSYREQQASGS